MEEILTRKCVKGSKEWLRYLISPGIIRELDVTAGKSVGMNQSPFRRLGFFKKVGCEKELEFIFPEKKFHKWQNFSTKKSYNQFSPISIAFFGQNSQD